MVKVITYGTYDLLHYGHIKLLERAKALGDYLIVGVTADDFDKTRGKINVQQSLMERIEAVRATGLADKIIVEEYEGQKIDDIRRYDVDIFTVGSDWAGKFDYLNEYCKVVYLPRTEGISSSEVRSEQCKLRMGIVGKAAFRTKFVAESKYVNGVDVIGVCASQKSEEPEFDGMFYTENYDELLEKVDAVYIVLECKYLRDKDERCGYVSGLMFFNQMGLTTQVPMMYEVVSNKATNDYRETSLAKSRVIVRKPKVPVTEKNYKALQFLDMLKDVDVYSEVTGKPLQDRLYRYMDDANLSISEMEPYFAYYPDKLYKNLVETRVIYKDMEEEILLEKKRGMAYKKLSLF